MFLWLLLQRFMYYQIKILFRQPQEIREAVSKLQLKVSGKVVALTEGFKSMYS